MQQEKKRTTPEQQRPPPTDHWSINVRLDQLGRWSGNGASSGQPSLSSPPSEARPRPVMTTCPDIVKLLTVFIPLTVSPYLLSSSGGVHQKRGRGRSGEMNSRYYFQLYKKNFALNLRTSRSSPQPKAPTKSPNLKPNPKFHTVNHQCVTLLPISLF